MSIEIEGEIKEWGNSFGIRLRKDVVTENKINGKVKLLIIDEKKSKLALSKLFGMAKDWKKPTQEIMSDIDKGY
jgi:antitoxin component of MazEF toxin-antitoxin module